MNKKRKTVSIDRRLDDILKKMALAEKRSFTKQIEYLLATHPSVVPLLETKNEFLQK